MQTYAHYAYSHAVTRTHAHTHLHLELMMSRSYAFLLHDHLHEYDKAEQFYKKILVGRPSSETKERVMCNLARLLQVESLED
jgi:hypothetical protein